MPGDRLCSNHPCLHIEPVVSLDPTKHVVPPLSGPFREGVGFICPPWVSSARGRSPQSLIPLLCW